MGLQTLTQFDSYQGALERACSRQSACNRKYDILECVYCMNCNTHEICGELLLKQSTFIYNGKVIQHRFEGSCQKFPTRCYYLRHVLYCWSNLGIANEVNLVARYFSSSRDDFEL